jgi:hypothetical protein
MGSINRTGQEFISELGHRISASIEDPRETCFLFQILYIRHYTAIQRCLLRIITLLGTSPHRQPFEMHLKILNNNALILKPLGIKYQVRLFKKINFRVMNIS